MQLTKLFHDFTNSERSSGMVLIACTVLSLLISNSFVGHAYLEMWHFKVFDKPVEFWINDGLMTVFFLLVGLEMEREIYAGELSQIKKAILPVIAAVGGMVVPALIHFYFNHDSPTQSGFGIPMATDIAFSLAILSLLGSRVPVALKIFLTALAIIDDLGAILVIALFYTRDFSLLFFGLAMLVFAVLLLLNRLHIFKLWIYLLLGVIMWWLMARSGIHATITGILLAFAIPFGKGDDQSISYKLQHWLHLPVAFIVLPLFALANTAIIVPGSLMDQLSSKNNLGIIFGLLIGKPAGIFLFSISALSLGWASLSTGVKRIHLLWLGFLAGIGFTMSIFITLLAFNDADIINVSKIAIIIGSVSAACIGFAGLKVSLRKKKLTPQPN